MFLIPAALSMIPIKPAELYDLLRACGANDVNYYPAVHPGCNKPCGAVRLTRILLSWRWFLLLHHFVSTWVQDCEHMQCYCFDGVWYCNTLCWSRLQGKASKTHARRLPRSPCSARRFHSIGSRFFLFSCFAFFNFFYIYSTCFSSIILFVSIYCSFFCPP